MPDSLIEHIRKLPHGRANLKQLLKERARLGEAKGHLLAELDRLAQRGEIVEVRKEHYQAIGIGRQYATGRMHVHRDGYGFVTPDVPISGLAGDVYIPKESVMNFAKTIAQSRTLHLNSQNFAKPRLKFFLNLLKICLYFQFWQLTI